MDLRSAMYVALIMGGRYRTGRKLTVMYYDGYGCPVTEVIDEVDVWRLRRDLDAMLRRGTVASS